MNIIDIHTHITPNVDDGSSGLKESIQMIEKSIEQGCKSLFLTPHSEAFDYYGHETVIKKMDLIIKEASFNEKCLINIYKGSEIYIHPYFLSRIINDLKTNQYLTMNNTNYILVEFDTWKGNINEILFCIKKLILNGWIPILAHVERYTKTFATIKNIKQLKEMGCLIQINLYSLDNEKNDTIRHCAREMLDNKLVDMVGTDAHQINHRPPVLKEGYQYIITHCNKQYADDILWKNAKRYLNVI